MPVEEKNWTFLTSILKDINHENESNFDIVIKKIFKNLASPIKQ